jgi:hypothetical protein
MTRCGGDFFTPLNAAGYYMLCPEGQGGGPWSVISSIGSVPIGNSKVNRNLSFFKSLFLPFVSPSLFLSTFAFHWLSTLEVLSHVIRGVHFSSLHRSPHPKRMRTQHFFELPQVTVYAKTQHTATDWSTVSPSPTSCGVIEAVASPPTPAPSPTPSPTPPSTPPPTPAPTPAPTPPPKVNGIDPCCNSACDFSACQPNGVIDATGGSMIIVYGYSLWDATSITVGGRECIPAASASTMGCGPTSNYGGLADSQCQCISPPGSRAMPVEVRGGKTLPPGGAHARQNVFVWLLCVRNIFILTALCRVYFTGSGGAAWSSVKDVVYGQVLADSLENIYLVLPII